MSEVVDQTWSQRWFPKSARPTPPTSPQVTVTILAAWKRGRIFAPFSPCQHTIWPATGCEEGDLCGRNGCTGTLQMTNPEPDADDYGCSCHIAPPCSYCVATRPNCPDCGWAMEAP